MMNILSQESFETIDYLIQNQSYENIVARMEVDLGPEDARFFSRFRQEGSRGVWYTERNDSYKPFKEASPQEQELIAIEMEERKKAITEKMQAKMPYIHNLFTVPSEDQIFFHIDENGDIRVTLAQWGFKARGEAGDIDVIGAIIARPRTLTQTDVWIRIIYSDELPAANVTLNLRLFNALNEREFKTDAEGMFHLGELITGKDFSVNDGNGHQEHFVVTPGQNEYVLNLPLYVNYEVIVQNQEGMRKTGYPLMLDDISYFTDEKGVVCIENVLLTPGKQILVRNQAGDEKSYSLSRSDNHFLYEIVDHFTSNLTVSVRFDSGEPVAGRKVCIGAKEYQADEEGKFTVSDLEPDTVIRVQDMTEAAVFVDKELARGENAVELVIAKPRPPMVRIRVFNAAGEPITRTNLCFETKLGPLEAVTDQDGAVYFPKELFTHKEKVRLRFEYVDPTDKKKSRKEIKAEEDKKSAGEKKEK